MKIPSCYGYQGVVLALLVGMISFFSSCECETGNSVSKDDSGLRSDAPSSPSDVEVVEKPCRKLQKGQNRMGLTVSFRYADSADGSLMETHLFANRSFTVKARNAGETGLFEYKGYLPPEEFGKLMNMVSHVAKSCGERTYKRNRKEGIHGFFRRIFDDKQALLSFQGIDWDDLSLTDALIVEKVREALSQKITELRKPAPAEPKPLP